MNRLYLDNLVSVGVVEAGDNPEARIMIYKNAQTAESGSSDKRSDTAMADTDLDVAKSLEEATARIAELEALLAESKPEPEDEDVTKTAPPEVQAVIKEQQDQIEQLAKSLESERTARRVAEYVEKAKPLQKLLGKSEEVGPVLAELADKAPEAFGRIESALVAAAQRLEDGDLFKTLGTEAEAETDPIAKREAFVKKYLEENPGTPAAVARAEFWKSHPDAVKEARS